MEAGDMTLRETLRGTHLTEPARQVEIIRRTEVLVVGSGPGGLAAALAAAQQAGDVLGANGILMDAYNTDVRPLLAELREDMGLDPDPIAAYQRSGYQERIVAERVGGSQAGWGA